MDRAHLNKEVKPKRTFVSKGEKATNFGTYAGVDWIFNAAAGVGFAYWGDRTALGQRIWSKPLTEFFTKALKPIIKDSEWLAKSAGYGNMFMSIIIGGMATLPPLLVLENNKVKKSIVHSLDNMIYGKETVENDPKFAKAHDEVLHAPKKDFGIGMGTRLLALSPLLGMVLFPPTRKLVDKYWFHPLANGTKKLSKAIGLQPKGLMKETAEHSQTAWDYIHASLAMDFGLGPFYAVLHSYFYNMFADRKAERQEKQEEQKAIAHAIAISVPKDKISEQTAKTEELTNKQEIVKASANPAEISVSEMPTPVIHKKDALLEKAIALKPEQLTAAPAM